MNAVGETRQLVKFGIELYNSDLNKELSDKVKTLILDQIGLQIGCSNLLWCNQVYEYFQLLDGRGNSSVVYHGDKTSPEFAAFINGTFGHGQDFDDTCLRVQTHPSAVILPVALAIGEEFDASGSDVLKAYAAGLEVMLRVAHSVSPGCLRRGHHTPQATGPYGAALAAGLLMGLSEDQLVNALGIAGSFSGGLIEYTQAGGSVKRIHTAIPTTAGIRAAYLAKSGLTGPESVLEGKKGFCNVYSDTTDISRLTDKLFEEYIINDVALKLYNCCYFIHAPIEAAKELVVNNDININAIKVIRIGTSQHGTVHVGRIVIPEDELGAQFSVQFTTALTLLKEMPGLNSYTQETLEDTNIQELAKKVVVYEDETCTAEYPNNWGAIVTIETHGGQEYTLRKRHAKGNTENPIPMNDLLGKFHQNADNKISVDSANKVISSILHIEELHHISELTQHYVAKENLFKFNPENQTERLAEPA